MAVVKINAISVPEQAGQELEKRFAARASTMDGVAGFLGFQLLRPTAGDKRYFVVTQWETDQDFDNWRGAGSESAHAGEQRQPVSTGAELLEFEVVLGAGPLFDK